MERKSYYCVCRCTPREGVVSMDARLLDEILDKGWKTINATENARVIAQIKMSNTKKAATSTKAVATKKVAPKAAETKTKKAEIKNAEKKNTVVSMDECKELGRRIDSLWRCLGHREMAVFERHARHYYHDMWLDKYCGSLP